jgi:hypothetical protein
MTSRCSLCVCVLCVSAYPPLLTFEALTNLSENWYVYHGTWAHLNGLIKKSLPSVCVYMCITLSLLGNGSVKVPLPLLGNGSVETLPR